MIISKNHSIVIKKSVYVKRLTYNKTLVHTILSDRYNLKINDSE